MLQSLPTFVAFALFLASAAAAADCPAESKTKTETIGGVEVSRNFVKLDVVPEGCIWVTEGSTKERYTSESCVTCRVSSPTAFSCLNVPTAGVEPPCSLALGPDCAWHKVDAADKTKACEEIDLWAAMRKNLGKAGGRK